MENLKNCQVVDFGVVKPCKVYTKRVNISSGYLVSNIERSKLAQPLDEDVFDVMRDKNSSADIENRFIVRYVPPLPRHKNFAYMIIHFEDSSTKVMYLKGATTGSDIEFSVSRVHFKTHSKLPKSQFKFTMENFSNCEDYFCWDFVPEDSDVNIEPNSGVVRGHSRLELSITFTPKKIGLFYRAFPCLFKFHEPLYVDIFGFHSDKKLDLDLDKYIHLNKPMLKYPTNYCRYMSDSQVMQPIQRELPVTVSTRYIDFGRIPVDDKGKRGHIVDSLILTNNDEKDLVVVWSKRKGSPFRIEPPRLVLRSLGGSSRFSVSFSPTIPRIFYRAELHASFLWGIRLEHKAPFTVTVHVIGDSFTTDSCGWGPFYSLERTRIALPGTVPNIPSYTTFQISKEGPLPIQFKMEPIDKTNIFVVKPREGIIKGDFGLIVIQHLPQEPVDVLFKEEWMLTLNKFAQVKLEICGSCELPFLLAGEDKNVTFPKTAIGSYSYLDVPIKNPTRLELEYQFQPSPSDSVLFAKDTRMIGPGETQSMEIGLRCSSMGTCSVPQGIRMRWAPYHPGAKRVLGGKDIHSETILLLTGTAEDVRIHATPDVLTMTDVFLNDVSNGSFILNNDGNTMAHIRLLCNENSIFSYIGKWTISPNDINLRPGQSVEVKVLIEGREMGYNVFEILYATYESHLFRIETSKWTNLIQGQIFVFFFSLKIIDIRYDGLAKSLSKHVLWSLLQINSLNDILGNLKENPLQTASMKIPDYHMGTPPLKIELLIKNTCPIPLWLDVHIEKLCMCSPQKNDTISRRITNYSCIHDGQLTGELDHRQILAGETVVVTLTMQYDETEECHFTMSLFVSRKPVAKPTPVPEEFTPVIRHPENSCSKLSIGACTKGRGFIKAFDPAVVRISVERGIIDGSVATMNFLLPEKRGPCSFKFSLEDVFIGDNSKYVQVIWMYNHSQRDTRYWTEWLYVNNKAFKILNSRARVAAYSAHPLLIEFIPFEMKTYRGKLAVVDEVGEEFHITIQAHGSVCRNLSTIRMMNKMPLYSHFVNPGADIELSQNHIALSPMPTHSIDKYIFFMKNNSKDVICFSWEKLVIWSTIKVMVQPKQGELQPGEIFPVQMHVHSYRMAAIFNFFVECIYYSKTIYNEYWQKCRMLKKVSKNFDSCFVFLPDKEIEIAYHNPVNTLNAGVIPMNKIVSIGGSVHIFNREQMEVLYPSLSQQLKFLPPAKIDLVARAKDVFMSKNQFFVVTEMLSNVIRTLVSSAVFKECLNRKRPDLRYVDYLDKDQPTRKKLPGRQMGMLVATLLYSELMKLFGVEPLLFHDMCTPVTGRLQHHHKMFKMFNEYYEQMLSTGLEDVCMPPDYIRTKRTQSRDQLAFVKRMSI